MAAEIVEHSCKSRGLAASAAGTHFRAQIEGALNRLQILPSLDDPELYSVKVLPGTEFSFLLWLYGLIPNEAEHPDLVSAFHCPDIPGVVYVETKKPKMLYWAVCNQRGVCILAIVPVRERPMLLNLPDPGPHLGWGRIVDKGRYGGDLVLITWVDYGLVVPRIKPVEDKQEDAMRAICQVKPGGSRKVRPAPKLFYTSEQVFNSPTIMGRVMAGNLINKEVLYGNWCFLDGGLSTQMEEYVEGVRDTGPKKPHNKKPRKATVVPVPDEGDLEALGDEDEDGYEHPSLKLPHSVLDGCEASFKAADERREKASTQFYDDMALMALLCHHDCVLWLVNMHSSGEKQFNVWLLLETLFQHLPLDITVGFLYDIACQVERSAMKWGFLVRYIHQLAFAVAVFHAFGHEWACQILYHPRKRKGFGSTNGEGCKRFWHAISHLIAHLRISSVRLPVFLLEVHS
jgi:hypothetical protein